jgi:hypothetical protein
MKKVLSALVMLLLLASLGYAQGQDNNLSVHDIMANGVYQGCRSCHIPHGGAVAGATPATRDTLYGTGASDYTTGNYKLWDKLITTYVYQVYSSDMVNSAGSVLQPTATTDSGWHSYLCFSCHDGLVAGQNLAVGAVGEYYLLTNNAAGDSDLMNDHPVNIPWPTDAWGVAQYDTVANVTGGSTVTGWVALPLWGTSGDYIECATCHDPHKQPGGPGQGGNFLRTAVNPLPNNVDFCRTCHLGKR